MLRSAPLDRSRDEAHAVLSVRMVVVMARRKDFRVLTHERFAKTPPADPHFRELVAVREILHAHLTADRPEEVAQFALDRVSPLLGASFASVYLIDGASELMRLSAAHNWPAKFRPWLSAMRVRVGFGPSGEAAAERRPIEVPDVLADRTLDDWSDVAHELGFRSLVALPLQGSGRVLGAVTFYFAAAGSPTDDRRSLMRLVADQMAAAAEKAALLDQLRRADAALADASAELERQYGAVRDARQEREAFLNNVSHELRTPLTFVLGHVGMLLEEISGPISDRQRKELASIQRSGQSLLQLVDDLIALSDLRRRLHVDVSEFDPGSPLMDAVQGVQLADGTRPVLLPAPDLPPRLRSDRAKVTTVLIRLLRFLAERGASASSVRAGYNVEIDRISYFVTAAVTARLDLDAISDGRIRGSGGEGSSVAQQLALALARELAKGLGGTVHTRGEPGADGMESTVVFELPLEYDPATAAD